MRQIAPGAGVCSGRGKETIERYLRSEFTWHGFVFNGRTEVGTYIYEPIGATDLSWRAMVHSEDMGTWVARIWSGGALIGEKKGKSPQSALNFSLQEGFRKLKKQSQKTEAAIESLEYDLRALRASLAEIDSFKTTFGASL